MQKEKLEEAVKLTLAVYRLTDRFPESEILKTKIREVSLGLLSDFISESQSDIIKKVRLLGAFFILAQKQKFINGQNYRIVFENYKDFFSWVKPEKSQKEIIRPEPREAFVFQRSLKKRDLGLKRRQELIVDVLENNRSGLNFGGLTRILKDKGVKNISERTVRNELKRLVDQKIVWQSGWARQSVYKLAKNH